MAAYIRKRTGQGIRVTGPDSAYRTYARQQYWRSYWCNRGACGNAAYPGTSNHGWGLAVDVPSYVRQLIDAHGRQFGWAKEWSDAAHEWWHLKYRAGVWSGRNPGPSGAAPRYPTLERGDKGAAVKRAQRHLRRWNWGLTRPDADGRFGSMTQRAVRQFQIAQGLRADGVIGARTWRRLRSRDVLLKEERRHVNRIQLLRRRKPRPYRRILRERIWVARQAHSIRRTARKQDDWQKLKRGRRYKLLRRVAGRKVMKEER